MKLTKILAVAALLLTSVAANAAAVNVNFTVNSGNWGTGSFSGVDGDSDGFLRFNELTAFNMGANVENEVVNLSNLFDIGDYDIVNNVWAANGIGWVGNPDNSYITWNNRNNSINSLWAVVSTTQGPSAVPVPAAVWLFGSALVGLLGSKRKKMLAA